MQVKRKKNEIFSFFLRIFRNIFEKAMQEINKYNKYISVCADGEKCFFSKDLCNLRG